MWAWVFALGVLLAGTLQSQALLDAAFSAAPVPPGQVAVCRVRGLAPEGLILAGFHQEAGFYYSAADGAQVALLAVPLGTRTGSKRLQLRWPGGAAQRVALQVGRDPYPHQRLKVPGLKRKLKKAASGHDREVLEKAEAQADTGQPRWHGPFLWPVDGPQVITSEFGSRRDYNRGGAGWRHKGMDLRAAKGTEVLAANDGQVLLARRRLALTGGTVVLGHGYCLTSSYFHLSRVDVTPGQFLLKGQRLGLSGSTGLSSGPHLHWQMDLRGVPVAPQQWLSPSAGSDMPPAPLP